MGEKFRIFAINFALLLVVRVDVWANGLASISNKDLAAWLIWATCMAIFCVIIDKPFKRLIGNVVPKVVDKLSHGKE